MAAGAAADGDQAVGAGFERPLGVAPGGYVVEGDSPVVVDLPEHVLGRALGGEDDGPSTTVSATARAATASPGASGCGGFSRAPADKRSHI